MGEPGLLDAVAATFILASTMCPRMPTITRARTGGHCSAGYQRAPADDRPWQQLARPFFFSTPISTIRHHDAPPSRHGCSQAWEHAAHPSCPPTMLLPGGRGRSLLPRPRGTTWTLPTCDPRPASGWLAGVLRGSLRRARKLTGGEISFCSLQCWSGRMQLDRMARLHEVVPHRRARQRQGPDWHPGRARNWDGRGWRWFGASSARSARSGEGQANPVDRIRHAQLVTAGPRLGVRGRDLQPRDLGTLPGEEPRRPRPLGS